MDLFIIIIFLLAVIIAVGYYWYEEKRYKETEYYHETKNSYGKVRSDKGLAGEFTAWEKLKDIPGYHNSLFNCYVPKKNKGTTEIDFIFLHVTGIYIFES